MDEEDKNIGSPQFPKGAPFTQKVYDDNRTRFGAETSQADVEVKKCEHKKEWLVKKGEDIECSRCLAGWPGLARHFTILQTPN